MADTWGGLINKIMTQKNSPVTKILLEEGKRLKECIQKYLDEYYDTYTGEYATGNLQKSLRSDDFVEINSDGSFSVKVFFDDKMAWGGSWLNDYDGALKPYVVAYGYKDMSFQDQSFYGFKGYDFIGMGLDEFEKTSRYNLKVLLTKPSDTSSIWR